MDPDTASPTLLAHLVSERHWTQADFCREYAQAALQTLGEPWEVSSTTVSRWLGGRLIGLPHPAQQQVLKAMFKTAPKSLFGPPTATPPPTAPPQGGAHDSRNEVAEAAAESAKFLMAVERAHVGPHTIDQFAADLRRIVTIYPNRPVYPLFTELRELRDRAFELLEGHQHPRQSRDLYLITAAVCGVLANASFDMGNLPAAETQARTAYLCAELAGHNELRAWIRGTQSLVAYWDNRPQAAVELAAAGARQVPEHGTALIRLAAIEARAHGQMRNRAGVDDALSRASTARDALTGDDEFGGMMRFPHAKLDFYAATARLWLGDPQAVQLAERDAANAVAVYERAQPHDRRLGEESLARLDLALARLHTSDTRGTPRRTPELDGAAAEIRTVLDVSSRRPTDSVSRRLRQVAAVLVQPPYHGCYLAAAVAEEISERTGHTPPPAITVGHDQ